MDTQKEESSSEIKKDHVIKTNPAAGSKRASGTTVTLTVSTAAFEKPIPIKYKK